MPSRFHRHRNRAVQFQLRRCHYCGVLMWLKDPQELPTPGLPRSGLEWLKATAEHLHARRDGGPDTGRNIVAACRLCNHKRHDTHQPLDPEMYRAHVQERVRRGGWHERWVHESGLFTDPDSGAS
jgi:5-methylcytosine-specific restriction endonuclease McrA